MGKKRKRVQLDNLNEPLRFSDEAIKQVNDGRVKRRLQNERKRAQKIVDRVGPQLWAKAGVTDVGVGLHLTAGTYTLPPRIAIRVYVKTKKALPELPDRFAYIPKEIDGVPVNVIEQRYRGCASDEPVRRRDPLKGGISIALKSTNQQWGTLGMIVYKDGDPRYLTNSHVAPNREAPVIQPPLAEVDDPIIGHVELPVRNMFVDCATILPSGTRQLEDGILGLPGTFADDAPLTDADEGAEIVIAGAKSGFPRTGIVFHVFKSVVLADLGFFTRQMILIRKDGGQMVEGGDSGSIVVRKRTGSLSKPHQVVGLVIGEVTDSLGNHLGAVANHFADVKSKFALGIELNP